MSSKSGVQYLQRESGDWEEWREILAQEWRGYERDDEAAIPRYSIARLLGAPHDIAKKCACVPNRKVYNHREHS